MKITRLLIISTLAMTLMGCQKLGIDGSKSGATKDAANVVVATINGTVIKQTSFDFYVNAAAGRAVSELNAEQKAKALDSLIDMHVIAAQAQKEGLDKESETAAAIELSRLNVLQQAATKNYLKNKSPTDQELRAEYDVQIAKLGRNEYRAHHILVQSETYALEMLDRLKKGQKFESIAKDSLDPSGKNGGDLGWFTAESMVKPFADALVALQKGETTAKPVQTQFGWHIIRLDDTRELTPPPFDDNAKKQLAQLVMSNKMRAYSNELVKAAKIVKKI